MPDQTEIPVSSFPDAQSINGGDKVTGLQNNSNTNFTFSSILAWFVNAVKSAFVPVNRTVNGKTLDTNITLTASDVGAQPVITASGILKGNGAGGVSAAVPGTDYGTYSKPSGGIPSSDLANGVIPSVPSPSDSTPQALGTAAAGSSGNYSRADHVHQKPSAADIGAYVKPSGGIPSSDMASAVQTSLGLADSAYQLPSGGIPASDLASGVIPSVPSAYTSNPAMDGTASPGSSGAWARGDHVHPTDSTKAAKSDLTSIQATGTTNTTGAAIPAGAYFYLNGVLHRAKVQIDVNATFTVNTNCEQATVGSILTGTSMSASAIGMPGIGPSRVRAGIVFLNIYDFKPSSTSGTISGTLPQELRPIQTTSGTVTSADGTKSARISISTQGVITYTGVDTSKYHYGLISYPAAI